MQIKSIRKQTKAKAALVINNPTNTDRSVSVWEKREESFVVQYWNNSHNPAKPIWQSPEQVLSATCFPETSQQIATFWQWREEITARARDSETEKG